MYDLTNRVALVTGGAHRVGKAITLGLARAGANVVINYHSSSDAASATATAARALGVDALTYRADVADLGQVKAMVRSAQGHFGGVDVLVNAASLFQKTPIPAAAYDDWHRVTRILVDGAFYCSNLVAKSMLERGGGAIINIVDLSIWDPWPKFTAHAVGKSALMALTRQLAMELAPTVRVNAVAPGPVLPPPEYNEEQIQRIARRTLLARWGAPEDVADAVVFLVRSEYITGEVIAVDGGERLCRRK